ncbi:TetR family transcriptional regulator [Hydrogenivirga caldilitoris]|uniref:TetR family transcriptional regulator n=1 Tax=Hydrogenivirga caldilitoris TaxID=246264 RepID=A0A497XRE7_9AQUI|nr:TetR/AcrR family transcriptional regulator [Hydrogenivirga caldilitoris]RLJ70844.1 TetR family transcriptional regulator [Hydrogenivirga caldilitoris]
MSGRERNSVYIPTKERIMSAALRLFSLKGFKGTTVKDIAKEVDITEGAIYRHFSSKEEIIESLFERITEEIRKLVKERVLTKEDIASQGEALAETLLSYAFDNPDSFRFLTVYHILHENGQKEKLPGSRLLEAFREAYRRKKLRTLPEVAFSIVIGSVERLFILWELGIVKVQREVLLEELRSAVRKVLSDP